MNWRRRWRYAIRRSGRSNASVRRGSLSPRISRSTIRKAAHTAAIRWNGSGASIDARVAVALGLRQNAEAGAKALFGMRPVGDDSPEEGGGGMTNLLAYDRAKYLLTNK